MLGCPQGAFTRGVGDGDLGVEQPAEVDRAAEEDHITGATSATSRSA